MFIVLLAVENYRTLEPEIVTKEETAFMSWFDEEDTRAIRLINLPMGRGNSKFYGFYQTLSGYSHAEGLASRTPPEAYNYIESNSLLNYWNRHASLICTAENRDEYLAAVGQLRDDGFSHVVLHYSLLKPDTIEGSFTGKEPAYEDDFVAIYSLAGFLSSCS